jgi:thioredoxin 2
MAEALLIPCSACGAKNRVPPEKLEQGLLPVCGKCKAPLSANGKPVIVTDATFSTEVERSSVLVLVDLWAPWCGPCRAISPILEDLAAEMAGRVRVAKLNIDENPATTNRFNIRSIPALLFFRGGREVDRMVGVQPKAEIIRRLEQLLR